jgi:hypothetical protein
MYFTAYAEQKLSELIKGPLRIQLILGILSTSIFFAYTPGHELPGGKEPDTFDIVSMVLILYQFDPQIG